MASSYTGLGTELMTTGENAGTWGTTTNTNLQIIEQISGGYVEQSVTSTPTTLSVSDGSTGATLAHRVIKFTGTISANTTVTVPLDVQQVYVLVNGSINSMPTSLKVSRAASSITLRTSLEVVEQSRPIAVAADAPAAYDKRLCPINAKPSMDLTDCDI